MSKKPLQESILTQALVHSRSVESAQPARCKKGLSQAARSPGKLKGSSGLHHPLGLLLDKFRSAEASWLKQRAELRHAMEGHKRRADKAELELSKLQVMPVPQLTKLV